MNKVCKTGVTANNSNGNTTSKPVGKKVNKKWNEAEDKILLECIKEHPENLRCAFKNASNKTCRTIQSCSARWYNEVSKRKGKDAIAFMCVSKNKIGKNRKSIRTDIGNENASIWNKIWCSIINFFK